MRILLLLAFPLMIISSLLIHLGNFWFVYGIWPKSWWAFFGFGLLFYAQGEFAKWWGKNVMKEFK